MLDIAEKINDEFSDEPMLHHLLRDKRFFGLNFNTKDGRLVSAHLTISFLSKSEKERRRKENGISVNRIIETRMNKVSSSQL